jgi:nitrous oxidase accessory protein NosD
MNARAIVALGLSALLFCTFVVGFNFGGVKASDTDPVHNINTGLSYASIQDAINAPETMNGHTILVDAGTYSIAPTESIVVNKSLSIIGSGSNTTVINGGEGGTFVVHVVASNVLIEGFAINGSLGITFGVYFDHSDNSVLRDSSIANVTYNDGYAVYAAYSNSLTIDQNVVGPDTSSGILITNSLDFNVSGNYVHNNSPGYGINANASLDGLITGNNAYENYYDGIGLASGSKNITITKNNISNNELFGVDVIDPDCVDNVIYDNNITGNGKQASVSDVSPNSWDNGVEGNYWSDYQTMYPSAFEIAGSGIWDTPYVLSANDTDNFPLMGPFSVFATSLGFDVDVVSNSSIASFVYFLWNGSIMMDVGSTTVGQTFGFCRVSIPHGLMSEPYNVTVDGANPLYWNYTVYDDGASRWIYFLYPSSDSEVLIRGRSPPPTVSIISPENKTYTVTDVPLTFAVNENTSLAYSLDGHSNVTITGNTTLPGVSNGTHSLVLYARNGFGDVSNSGIVYFTVIATASGPFPFLLVTVVAIVLVLAVALVYLRKRTRRRGKNG